MAWLLLLLLAWQPIYWSAKAIYHKAKGDTWDAEGYFADVKNWFTTLWGLINPKEH